MGPIVDDNHIISHGFKHVPVCKFSVEAIQWIRTGYDRIISAFLSFLGCLKQHLLSEHFLADKGNDLQCEKCEQCQRARELVQGSKMITNDHQSSSYNHTVSYSIIHVHKPQRHSLWSFCHWFQLLPCHPDVIPPRTALGLRPTSGSGGVCHGSGWRLGSSLRFGALLLVQSCPRRRRMGPGKPKGGGFRPRLGHFRVRLNSTWFNDLILT